MAKDLSETVFIAFMLLCLILVIGNAPILETQKKYVFYFYGFLFILLPTAILSKWGN